MEESRALSKLNDATDLLVLLEDLLNPSAIERLSQASWSGVRLTLRNARSILQESQIALSKEFVGRARNSQAIVSSSISNTATEGMSANGSNPQAFRSSVLTRDIEAGNGASDSNGVRAELSGSDRNAAESRVQITRRDLKATLEKFIENR